MSMEDRDGEIWMDGSFVPWRSAKTHLLSYTFQHGAGVFEGLRCYEGERGAAIFRLADHVRRFQDSAKILAMEMPFDTAALVDAHCEVVRRNGLASAYIRPVCYYDGKAVGVSAVGNDVHVAIAAWTWDAYLGADAVDAGITVKTSSFARHHAASTLGKAKANGNYINSMLAVMEARRSGYRDALMLDPAGCVAECSTSNIFMVRHNRLATPDRSHILEGITRDTIMVLARDRDLAVDERRLTRDELYCADELFVTGTAAEITPVIALDDRVIGDGRPGEVTRCLQRAYADAVRGRDPAHVDWLTFIG